MLGWLVTGIRSMTDVCNNFDQDFGRLLPRPRLTISRKLPRPWGPSRRLPPSVPLVARSSTGPTASASRSPILAPGRGLRDRSPQPGKERMPRTFWTPARDRTLCENYPVLGPAPTASLLCTSRRSVINRAHRLGLRAHYPQDRASPGFPHKSWGMKRGRN